MRVVLLGSDGDDKSALAAALRRGFDCVDAPAAQVEQYLHGGANAAVLIINVLDSLMPEDRRHLELAQRARVPVGAVYLSRCNLVEDEELIDLVGHEAHEALAKFGVGGDATPIARSVQAVIEALGGRIPAVHAMPQQAAVPHAAAVHVVTAIVCSRCGAPLRGGLGEIQCAYCGTLNMVR